MSTQAEKAQMLITRMRELPSSKIFSQEECSHLVPTDSPHDLLQLLQDLLASNQVKLIKKGDELHFQAVSQDYARIISQMTPDEQMIYSHIASSNREGIWTKTLKAKTNLHQHIVTKCLKNLENQRFIKSIKSVKYPTRKIYMLYNLQPSLEVTGGAWFTDSELDTEFIDTVSMIIWRFIYSATFPKEESNALQSSYDARSPGANMDQIMQFLSSSNVLQVELELNDVQSLCNLLVFDDKIEQVGHDEHGELYKCTRQSLSERGYIKAVEELRGVIPEASFEYLERTKGYNLFDFNLGKVNYEEEADFVYMDSFLNN
ncbi:uncharacterized protein LODBEIA_P41350 [Lodderomyces beijingensis]|uniref:DNA-directed RNA polymerase III subunit RPC6 n=1 Tax=Lodderomyces beijingensis TaxID=1775926 RepID=A0ABP0ZP32_9ASCO